MGIPLVIAEPTGMYRRDLRRFTWGKSDGRFCPARDQMQQEQPWRGHDALVTIEYVPEAQADPVHGDNWPRDDERWPAQCDHCDYRFADDDQWQRNDNATYRRPDGFEFANWGSLKHVPPGTMWRLPWADEHWSARHPQHVESWRIALPDGGEWVTSQPAMGGGFWTVNGTPPMIDVSPSIWHAQPTGWHGFIRHGELVDA